jgi:outer membrane protein assembly factor BamB
VLDGEDVVSVLDVDALGMSHVASPILRGVLLQAAVLVSNDDRISALDARTGRLLWRSEPHTSRSNFVVAGDLLASAYGQGDKPGQLFLLRADSGKILARAPFRGAPDALEIDGETIEVKTEGAITRFRIPR